MRPRGNRHQHGAALIALVAVLALGASWYLVSRLNDESNVLVVMKRERNAQVLNRAKQALIGYVAAQAAKYGENRPGALPCPEAPADFDDAAAQGTVSYPCTLPVVGRFPWKTLGLDKLVDASGEPLWYAVAAGWAGASTVINSNCASYDSSSTQACRAGRLAVDGVTDDVIAVLIAPGPPMVVSAASGCTARSQVRPISGTPDWRDYLECENASSPADMNFVTTGPAGSFNDQVIRITTADLIPALEAAIAHRIELEIVPELRAAYTPAGWGFAGTKPVYPYPAPFADPSTSAMAGTAGTLRGLLPLVTSETYPGSRVACSSGTLCQPSFVAWSGASLAGGSMLNPNCAATSGATLTCNFYRTCFLSCFGTTNHAYTITASVTNVGMALRQKSVDATRMTNAGASPTVSWGAMNSAGAVPFTISGTTTTTTGGGLSGAVGGLLCGIPLGFLTVCKTESITIPMLAVLVDHPLLDTRTSGADTSWFIRNRWHEVTYYAVVAGHLPSAIASTPGCVDTPSVTCMNVVNVSPANRVRGVLILAGRSINGSARPSSTLADYLEFGNAAASFERQTVTTAPKSLQADTGTANSYAVAAGTVAIGGQVAFTALNTNTGASTLNTTATGIRNLVNTDGTDLAAGTIRAKAALSAVYDGALFRLPKRPFNDRIIVIDSN